MSVLIQAIEAEQINKTIPDFRAGDTVIVQVKVKEGNRERSHFIYVEHVARTA